VFYDLIAAGPCQPLRMELLTHSCCKGIPEYSGSAKPMLSDTNLKEADKK
jgi:hypothetical protein